MGLFLGEKGPSGALETPVVFSHISLRGMKKILRGFSYFWDEPLADVDEERQSFSLQLCIYFFMTHSPSSTDRSSTDSGFVSRETAPMFSVLISTFNRPDLLRGCLEALAKQTYSNFEAVVIGDGAPEVTADVVSTFPFVRYFWRENQGQVKARQFGLTQCRGEYVCLCDDDDRFLPEKLFEHAEILSRYPEVGFLFTDFNLIDEEGKKFDQKFHQAPPWFWDYQHEKVHPDWDLVTESLYARLLKFQPPLSSCITFRRNHFMEIGGFEPRMSGMNAEDFEYTLRACDRPPILIGHRPTTDIAKHTRNMSGNILRTLVSNVQVLEFCIQNHNWNPALKPLAEAARVEKARATCNRAFEEREWEIFFQTLPILRGDRNDLEFLTKKLLAHFPPALRDPSIQLVESVAVGSRKLVRGVLESVRQQ